MNCGKIEWQHSLKDLEKALDLAYQDVLNNLDSGWCYTKRLICCFSEQSCGHLEIRPGMGVAS